MVSDFLSARFGKDYKDDIGSLLNGNSLIDNAMDILTSVQQEVGGDVVYHSETDQVKYIQLLRFC